MTQEPGADQARLDRSSPVPLWSQLRDDLGRRVESGSFEDLFPGEMALARGYGVSRNTVREALRHLRAEGLVTAERGRRPRLTRAAEIEQPLGAIYSLFASLEARDIEQRSVVRALDVRLDDTVARRLGRDPAAPLLYLERLRLAGGEPLALDQIWLPANLASPLLDSDFRHRGLYDELSRRTGIRLTGGHERIRAVVPTRAERSLLQTTTGVAAFRIDRLGRAHDEPVEWRRTLVRGDRFSVMAVFSARGGYKLDASDATPDDRPGAR